MGGRDPSASFASFSRCASSTYFKCTVSSGAFEKQRKIHRKSPGRRPGNLLCVYINFRLRSHASLPFVVTLRRKHSELSGFPLISGHRSGSNYSLSGTRQRLPGALTLIEHAFKQAKVAIATGKAIILLRIPSSTRLRFCRGLPTKEEDRSIRRFVHQHPVAAYLGNRSGEVGKFNRLYGETIRPSL